MVRRCGITGQITKPERTSKMTIEEFNATGWGAGMSARYKGATYEIASCDFDEQLVGLLGVVTNEPGSVSWVRCENITVATPLAARKGTE